MRDEIPSNSEQNEQEAAIVVSPRRAAIRAYRGEIVFGSALSLYTILAVFAHYYAYFGWDLSLELGIQSITASGFGLLMRGVSMLGNSWAPTALVAAVCLTLFLVKLRIEGLVCAIGVGSGSALNRLFKALIDRPRPTAPLVQVVADVSSESFPSGHVVFFVEFFGFVLFLSYVLLKRGWFRRATVTIPAVLIALVGVSRVYLGAHWPSDVLGAYLAGGLWLMLMIEAYRRLKSRQQS